MNVGTLWQRALFRRATGRYWGSPRKHDKPRVGDVFAGTWQIAECLGSGRHGRSDASFAIQCIACGRRATVFEFNLRKRQPCRHGAKKTLVFTPLGVKARLASPSWPRCFVCEVEGRKQTRIAIRDGICALHVSRAEIAGSKT